MLSRIPQNTPFLPYVLILVYFMDLCVSLYPLMGCVLLILGVLLRIHAYMCYFMSPFGTPIRPHRPILGVLLPTIIYPIFHMYIRIWPNMPILHGDLCLLPHMSRYGHPCNPHTPYPVSILAHFWVYVVFMCSYCTPISTHMPDMPTPVYSQKHPKNRPILTPPN